MNIPNIELLTIKNNSYRKVIYTDKYQQLVLMALAPGEYIPAEVHEGTQFFRVEEGIGLIVVNKKRKILKEDSVAIVPPNVEHYIKNISKENYFKLYTIYSPPQHKDKKITKRQPKSDQ